MYQRLMLTSVVKSEVPTPSLAGRMLAYASRGATKGQRFENEAHLGLFGNDGPSVRHFALEAPARMHGVNRLGSKQKKAKIIL